MMSPERTAPLSMMSSSRSTTWPQVDDATLCTTTRVAGAVTCGPDLAASSMFAPYQYSSVCINIHAGAPPSSGPAQVPELDRQRPPGPLAAGDDQHGIVAR